nr:hypothetical protein [Tanacetum cinerariifolium]
MASFGYRLNPHYAIKECLSCGALYTRDCSCSKGNVEDKILVPKLPENCARCARCGHPVNGLYCQGCALLREKLKEYLVTYLKYFQDTSESSDDSTNVVNAPREPFVVKKDHGVNPPHIDKCCCECGNVFDGIFCQQCISANARYWKIPACCDDDDNYDSVITPVLSTEEPVNSLSMGDEHLDTILATESDEVIKSSVEDLVPIPSESEGENGCDVPSCFTTFSNILFDADYDFESVDVKSLHNEDVLEKIFLNPLFEEEIISIKRNQHHINVESDLVESMLNCDSSVISSSLKINSLLDEFVGELTLLKSIPPGIDKADCHPKNEICFSERLFDSHMEEINLSFNPDDPMPPSIEDDDNDSEGDNLFLERLLHDDHIPLPDTLDFSNVVRVFLPFFTYLVTSSILHPFGNEDTIFDPGITINHFCSFKPDDPMPPSIEDDDNDSEGDNLFLERLLHDDHIPLPDTLDFSNVVRVFLPFFTYLVTSSILHPFGNEDTIFDPGITINHFCSFKPGLSHRHLNEWPMIINGKNIPTLDVLLFHFYPHDQVKYGGN